VKLRPGYPGKQQNFNNNNNNNKTLSTTKLDLNLRKKPVKCYIWSIALYGTETGHFGGRIRNTWGSFEMWCW
jgi:hypothetical protein